MPQAVIQINGVSGSNDNVALNSLVTLANLNIGGELTYSWQILSQPPGPADSLSSTTLTSVTFTPKKEGTYLIKLTVNEGLPTEQSDTQIVGIRQIKSGLRIPAPGETTQAGASAGWGDPSSPFSGMNQVLRAIDGQLSDPVTVVGVNSNGGSVSAGTVMRATSGQTIKTGLPGQEIVPGLVAAPASSANPVMSLICVAISDIAGNTSIANNAVMKAKFLGRVAGIPITVAAGNPVYVSDTATISGSPGTNNRPCGTSMGPGTSPGTTDIWFDGVGGFEITPVNAAYVAWANPSPLTNAKRIDGANAQPQVGQPWRFVADSTGGFVALQAQGALGQTADVFQTLTSVGGVLTKVDASGNLGIVGGNLNMSTSLSQKINFEDFSTFEANRFGFRSFLVTKGSDDRFAIVPNGSLNTVAYFQNDAGAIDSGSPSQTFIETINTGSGGGTIIGQTNNFPVQFSINGNFAWSLNVNGSVTNDPGGGGDANTTLTILPQGNGWAGGGFHGSGGGNNGGPGAIGYGATPSSGSFNGGAGLIGNGGAKTGGGTDGFGGLFNAGGTTNGVGAKGTGTGSGYGLVGKGGSTGSGANLINGPGSVNVVVATDSGSHFALSSATADPGSPNTGDLYFNSSTLKLNFWTGSAWVRSAAFA